MAKWVDLVFSCKHWLALGFLALLSSPLMARQTPPPVASEATLEQAIVVRCLECSKNEYSARLVLSPRRGSAAAKHTPESAHSALSTEARVELPITIPLNGNLPLPGNAGDSWSISIDGADVFDSGSQRRLGTEPWTIDLDPAAVVVFRAALPEKTLARMSLADALNTSSLQISPSVAKGSEALATLHSACSVREGSMTCPIPRGVWDLKWQAATYAPQYFWQVEAAEGQELDLGSRTLTKGGSVVGWLAGLEAVDLAKLELVVRRQQFGWLPSSPQRHRFRQLESRSRPLASGFFQFSGLSTGSYSLSAVVEALGETALAEIEIDGQEVVFAEPFELQPPVRAEVYIEPPMDGTHGDWQITLMRLEPRTSVFKTEDLGFADSGIWQSRPLPHGSYRIEVADSQESTWHHQSIEIDATSTLFQIELDVLRVEGLVTGGELEAQSRVVFGSISSRPSLALEVDDDGNFQGGLPRAGDWKIDLLQPSGNVIHADSITVEANEDGVAFVEIEVPNTVAEGKVLLDGSPVAGAFVTARSAAGQERLGTVATDARGRFSIHGLKPGKIGFSARHEANHSPWVFRQIEESARQQIDLELPTTRSIKGSVTSGGAEIAGAQIISLTGGHDFYRPSAQVFSGVDGSFEIEIPDRLEFSDLIVGASGNALRILRVDWRNTEKSSIRVEMSQLAGSLMIPASMLQTGWLMHNGARVQIGPLVSLMKRIGRSRVDLENAAVVLDELELGTYILCAEATGGDCQSRLVAPSPPIG